MKITTMRKICELTPIAALALYPIRLPTSAWSTIPCSPPTTLVSIVGQASFQTAGRSGPSTIDRSYFLRPGFASLSADAIDGAVAAAVPSPKWCHRAPSSDYGVDAPWTRAGENEVQKEKAVEDGGRTPIHGRPERQRETELKVRHSHLAGQHKRDRPGQKSEGKRRSQVCLQKTGEMKLPHRRHR